MSYSTKRGLVIKYAIGFIIGFVFCISLLFVLTMPAGTRVYDCGMAEWHPDIPNEVKEECRKRRLESSRFTT